MVRLLIDYADKTNTELVLNGQNGNGDYPLLLACEKNNIEMTKLLMDYSERINVKLELNEKNKFKTYPLYLACKSDSVEMVRLLIHYATKNNIPLKFQEMKTKNSEINELLQNYKKMKEEKVKKINK